MTRWGRSPATPGLLVLQQRLRSERKALDELLACLAKGEPPGRDSRFYGATLAEVARAVREGTMRADLLRGQIEMMEARL